MAKRDTSKRNKAPAMMSEQARTGDSTGSAQDADAKLGNDVQRFIGDQLRAVYDEVLKEPVPDRFVKLLEELERKAAKRQ